MEQEEEKSILIDPSHATPLTEWENPPEVKDLKADFTSASSDHSSHVAKIDAWLDILNITGSEVITTADGHSKVQPKTVRKQYEWRYPALTEPLMGSTDLYSVDPVTYEDKGAAVQNALVLNNQVTNQLDKVAFIDSYIRTGVDEGTVIVKTGWRFEEEEVEEMQYEYVVSQNPNVLQQYEQMAQQQEADPAMFYLEAPLHMQEALKLTLQSGRPMVPVEAGMAKVMKTSVNQPVWDICNYKNVVIDPTCEGKLEKAQFVVHSFETSLAELKRDARYKNLDFIAESSSSLSAIDFNDSANSFAFKDKPRKKLVVHEYWGYWDIHNNGTTEPIVAAYIDEVMVRLEPSPFKDGLPFVAVPMLPVRNSCYGEPDAELIADNQRIIGALTRGTIDVLARSANGQVGYAKGAFDITNKRKFESGDDYEFNPQTNPDQMFHMHKYPELPQSSFLMLQSQTADAESMTGVRPFAQSQTGSIGSETAAGVKSANDATSKRDTAILRRFADGVVKLGKKTIAMNQQFLEEREVVRITNEEFVAIRKQDLEGNFDLKVTIATAEEDQAKAQELAFMMQTMGNTMDAGMSSMILADIARLRKMPELEKKLRTFKPEPDPLAIKKAELEIALLEAEVATEQAKAQEINTQAELNMAKARESASVADLSNLDYLEQESGTKQERDLQKLSQQSKAQAETKMIEARMKREDSDVDYARGQMDNDRDYTRSKEDQLHSQLYGAK